MFCTVSTHADRDGVPERLSVISGGGQDLFLISSSKISMEAKNRPLKDQRPQRCPHFPEILTNSAMLGVGEKKGRGREGEKEREKERERGRGRDRETSEPLPKRKRRRRRGREGRRV